MAWLSCEQNCCRTSNNRRFCYSKYHLQVIVKRKRKKNVACFSFLYPIVDGFFLLGLKQWNIIWWTQYWNWFSIFPVCSNSVNIYVGIGIPWLIDTTYNFIAYRGEPLRIQNAAGLSFSLLIFFLTSIGCIAVLVLRRITLGAELGGPRIWAWLTSAYFMFLWIVFVVLSSLKVSGFIWIFFWKC